MSSFAQGFGGRLGRRGFALVGVLVVALAVGGYAVTSAVASYTCTDNFTGASGGDWATASNWTSASNASVHALPTSSDVACWAAGTTVSVSNQYQTATAAAVQGGSLSISGGQLTIGDASHPSSTVADFTFSGGWLGGPAGVTLNVTGNFDWTGGTLNPYANSPSLGISQTGGGSFAIDGAGSPSLRYGPLSTTRPITFTNPNFGEAGTPQITTTSTITFSPGNHAINAGAIGLSAAGVVTSGATDLTNWYVGLTGSSSSLGGNLTVAAMTNNAGTTLTIPTGDNLTAGGGTINGTLTGPGSFTQAYSPGTSTTTDNGTMTVDHVSISNGQLTLAASSSYTALSTLVSGGTLEVDQNTSLKDLTITGSGHINGPSPVTLTVTGNFDWTGPGPSGINTGTNHGLAIVQTGSGSFAIDGTGQALFYGGSMTTPNPVTFTNTNFGAWNGAALTTTGTLTVGPGTYDLGGGGMGMTAAALVTSGATRMTGFYFDLTSGATTLGGDFAASAVSNEAGATLTMPSGVTLTTSGGTFNGTVTGPGTYAQGGIPGPNGSTVNGTMSVDHVNVGGGKLTLAPSSTYTALTTALTGNNGTLVFQNDTQHVAHTGDLTESAGYLQGPGNLAVSGNFSWTNGSISQAAPIAVTQSGGGSFSISGSGGSFPYLLGGSLSTTSPISITNPSFETASFSGRASVTTTSTLTFGPGLVVPVNGGDSATFTAAGIGANAGPSYGLGADSLVLTGGATTVVSGNTLDSGPLTIQGGTLQDDGTLQTGSGGVALTGGTLKGAGSVTGSIGNTGGTVAPGDSPGTLTVSGNYSQGAGGTLAELVNGTGAGQFSKLSVSGNVSLGGTLALQPSSAYAASAPPGDTIGFLPYSGTLSGQFSSTTVNPPLTSQESFTPSYSTANVVNAVVGNPAPPSNTGPPSITPAGAPAQGQTLTASNGTWSNNPVSYVYQWQDCDASGASCSSIAGATTSSYTLAASDVGHTVRVLVTASNAGGSSAPVASAPTGVVKPPPPSNTSAPSISGSPAPGQTLTCTNGTWSNSPTGYAYGWNRDGAPIGGAANQTYTVQGADQGHALSCTVTASNAGGLGSKTSNPVSVPAPSPLAPSNTSPPTITGTALPGDTLSCDHGAWSGNPSSFSYQWERDSSPIAAASQQQYTVQIADEGHTLVCVVSASNAAGTSGPAASAGVLVAVPGTLSCPKPSGSVGGGSLGSLRLGMSRARARTILRRYTVTVGHFDDFCLFGGWGIRAGYPSSKLLGKLSPAARAGLTGRIIMLLTANPFYSLQGVRAGMTVAEVQRQLQLSKPFQIGANTWYVVSTPSGRGVLKVRHGVVQEVGVVNGRLSQNHRTQTRLLTSFT